MVSVEGKVILITGSSRGIGRATAIELARQGAHVVINGRSPEQLAKTKNYFESLGLSCMTVQADVTDIAMCQNMMDQIIKAYNRIDVLITNAGLVMESNFEDTDPMAFKMILDSHLYGTFFPVKVALPYIEKTKGSIIMISSLAGLYGMPKYSAYCAGKMALTAFWQGIRLEKRGSGIHFGLMHLAFVKNDIEKTLINSEGKKVSMPPRPSRLQLPQEKVALRIIKMIKKRQGRKIHSLYGKIFAFFARFSHPIMNFWLIFHNRS